MFAVDGVDFGRMKRALHHAHRARYHSVGYLRLGQRRGCTSGEQHRKAWGAYPLFRRVLHLIQLHTETKPPTAPSARTFRTRPRLSLSQRYRRRRRIHLQVTFFQDGKVRLCLENTVDRHEFRVPSSLYSSGKVVMLGRETKECDAVVIE